jgi:FMN reductase
VKRIVALSAGLNRPSSTRLLTDRLAAAALSDVDASVAAFELRDTAHDVVNHLLTGFAPSALREVLDAVAGADGLIAVTPIFNASASGLFTSFFNVVESLEGLPVLAGATGGTARHSLALEHSIRPMLTYLKAIVVPTAVYAATEDFADASLQARVDRAGREFAALVAGRPATAVKDPFALTTTFDELLGGR